MRKSLAGGVAYDFEGGGVDRFRITGIEASAGLDPRDVTSFITGLTFARDGNFTGTMTPLVQEIPEPSALCLLSLGLLSLVLLRRPIQRRQARLADFG